MALEEAILENTKAVNNLSAIMAGNPAAGTAGEVKRGPGRPRKPTLAEVKAIAEKVMEAKDKPAAVALIKKHGANTLAELDESKYAAFIAAAEVVLADEGETGGSNAEL